jgi:hypothetical protein
VVGAVLMLLLRHPMRVALALIAVMISLGGIYGLLGVHFIAVFQVLIYVGAVMVFMVYAIMLLDVRDRFVHRPLLAPAVARPPPPARCWRACWSALPGRAAFPRSRAPATASACSRSRRRS